MRKRIKKILGRYSVEKVHIVPYRSYGTSFHLYVKGRVLDNSPLHIAKGHSFFGTLKNTVKQFDTHEVPGVTVAMRIGDTELTAVADNKGYFLFDAIVPVDIRQLSDEEGWLEFELYTTDEAYMAVQTGRGELLVPEPEADYGVISDIDDTILHTGVTSFLKWKLLKNSLFTNAYRRIPLAGAPEFFNKLHLGKSGKNKNPIFYISNSPWNMYDYLRLFLDHNNFPKGPILLRTFSSIFQKALGPEKPHKQKEIINILDSYPSLKFILIGDSGEHDASIYTEIAAQYPDRILCIYLKSVKHRRQMARVRSIVDNFRITPVLMADTSAAAEAHARENGYI